MIRFGILGCGNIAHRFCRSLMQNKEAELYAVASSSLEKQKVFQELYHAKWTTADYQALISCPEVDVVYIATRHADHARWAEACLKAKKAVLCEKPMALSEQETRRLIEIARKEKVFLMEALKGYFMPCLDHLLNDINNGLIGDVLSVEASFNSDVPLMPGKYLFEKGQGGALNDVGIYPLSFVLKVIDEPIQSIDVSYCQHPQAVVDSFFEAVLHFESNKKAVISGAIDRNQEKTAIIQGTQGRMLVPYYYRPTSYTIENEAGVTTYQTEISGDDMQGEIAEVIACVKHKCIESNRYSFEKMLAMAHYQDLIRAKMVLQDD